MHEDLEALLADSRASLALTEQAIVDAGDVVAALGEIGLRGNTAHDADPGSLSRILAGMQREYSEQADRLNAAVPVLEVQMTVLDRLNKKVLDYLYAEPDALAQATKFLQSIRRLGEQARESFDQHTLPDSMDGLGEAAPVLQATTTRLSSALRRIEAAVQPVYGWADRADALLG